MEYRFFIVNESETLGYSRHNDLTSLKTNLVRYFDEKYANDEMVKIQQNFEEKLKVIKVRVA